MSGDNNVLVSTQKYICIDNKMLLNIYIGDIYTICKYQNELNKRIFYRIYNNKHEWKHSFDKNSPFDIRLKETFISISELRKQKIDHLNSL